MTNNSKTKLKKEVEDLRKELLKVSKGKDLSNQRVQDISQKLDEAILKYTKNQEKV